MQRLKGMKIWLCWRYEKGKDGKPRKVPYSAAGCRTGTSQDYIHDWVDFDQAQQAAEVRGFDGVGFVLPKGCFLLDIDHQAPDAPLAKELVERFSTYTETSVSGQGIHIIGICDPSCVPTCLDSKGHLKLSEEYYQKNSRTGIELYIGGLTNRYATYSGNVMKDIPVRECTEEVLATLDRHMRREEQKKTRKESRKAGRAEGPEPAHAPMDTDETETAAFDLVTALRDQKNGEKFIRLYDHGDTTGFGSQSEADLSLCSMIAFRAGDNPDLIDAVFRSSRLYREKWDREDYRDNTIRKAIALCGGQFHPSALEHPPFIRLMGKRKEPTLIPSLLAQYIRETVPFILVQNNSRQSTQIFVYEDGCYRLYDKQRMLGKIKEPVEAYDIELVNMNKIQEVYNQLISDRERVLQKELNEDEHLINFENGILQVNPTELVLYPHSPDILSTIQIPCAWKGEEIPTPVFDEYIKALTNNDPEIIRLLLQYIGMCISNVKGWRTKKALFLVGPGDTGKSVIKALVEQILGEDNFIAIDLQEIEARFGTGMLYGTRLAGSSDMSYISVSELKTFKKLTGGDGIFAEFKGQQGFEYTYTGLLWFCMNRLPKFGGDDGKWVYDRIMIVRCNHVIPKEKQDKELLDKLYKEREGIIYKAVKALQTVMENGYRYSEPASVQREREEYLKENNTVISFFTECMCRRLDMKKEPIYTVSEVYSAYLDYCHRNGYLRPKTSKEFRETLMEYLHISDYSQMAKHYKKGTCYIHYTLMDEIVRNDMEFLA